MMALPRLARYFVSILRTFDCRNGTADQGRVNMSITFSRVLGLAVVAMSIVIAIAPASALSIRNCTDINIRVSVFKGKDKIKLIPIKGGKASIGKGKLHKFRTGKDGYQIRVYRSAKLTRHIYEHIKLRGSEAYSIRGKKGQYSVSGDPKCPPADVRLLPATGVWKTNDRDGEHFIRIRRTSPTSFDLTHLPNGAVHPFEHTEGDHYSNGYTTTIEVLSQTRIVEINHLLLDSKSVYRFVRP